MDDHYNQLVGAWIDAAGTIISLLAEVRELAGLSDFNNRLTAIGETLQAIGPAISGSVQKMELLDFAGNWINGAGAATSALAAYLQESENGEENMRLEILGDSLQFLGNSTSTVSNYQTGENEMAIGNGLQALGAGLETVGGVLDLRGEEQIGQILLTLGALGQVIGSNYNALYITQTYHSEH